MAAGGSHSLGLKADGSIVAWGWNGYGQCNVPAPNADFVAVAAGWLHSLGLTGQPIMPEDIRVYTTLQEGILTVHASANDGPRTPDLPDA